MKRIALYLLYDFFVATLRFFRAPKWKPSHENIILTKCPNLFFSHSLAAAFVCQRVLICNPEFLLILYIWDCLGIFDIWDCLCIPVLLGILDSWDCLGILDIWDYLGILVFLCVFELQKRYKLCSMPSISK